MSTLAVAIAAVVAMLSIYERVVLRPLDLDAPDSLVSLRATNARNVVPPTLSWPCFQLIQESAGSFEHVGAASTESVSLTGEGPAEEVRSLRVSGAFFQALRVSAARGRLFEPGDDLPNGPEVCVLSHELWQSRFGGGDVLGKLVTLAGRSAEIVGILPPRLSAPWSDRQLFLPRVFDDSALAPEAVANGASYLDVVGRLRPGVTAARAGEEMAGISADYADRFAGRTDSASSVEVRPLTDVVTGDRRDAFAVLLAGVAAVLLVACANVAALFLSRLAGRQRDIAVRQALGASRVAIAKGVLAESATLAAAAGLLGTTLAFAILAVVRGALGDQLPPGLAPAPDYRALLSALGVAGACALLVGPLPALHAARPASLTSTGVFDRGSSDGAGARRFRAALAVAETSLSATVLVAAVLLVASFVSLTRTSPGFEPSGVAAAFTNLGTDRYDTPERQLAFFTGTMEQLRRDPGVTGVATAFGLPFHDGNYSSVYAVAGQPIPAPADRPRAGVRSVTEGYFRVMGIRLLAGRLFTSADHAGSPGVCIVNESLARRLAGGGSALGQVILRGRAADRRHEIVGVVADLKTNGLREMIPDEIFFSFTQVPRRTAAILARSSGDPATLAGPFRAAVAAVDPDQPLAGFATMEARLDRTLGTERIVAVLSTAFAVAAVALAALGLYAVLAHGVQARAHEIGIRLALGAERSRVVRRVVSESLRLAALGVALGLLAATWVLAGIQSHLYGVSAREPWAYALVALAFAGVGLAAALVPALRASRVDPAELLRCT